MTKKYMWVSWKRFETKKEEEAVVSFDDSEFDSSELVEFISKFFDAQVSLYDDVNEKLDIIDIYSFVDMASFFNWHKVKDLRNLNRAILTKFVNQLKSLDKYHNYFFELLGYKLNEANNEANTLNEDKIILLLRKTSNCRNVIDYISFSSKEFDSEKLLTFFTLLFDGQVKILEQDQEIESISINDFFSSNMFFDKFGNIKENLSNLDKTIINKIAIKLLDRIDMNRCFYEKLIEFSK